MTKKRAFFGFEFSSQSTLETLRMLATHDRRSVGFLIRDAIDLYLEKRAAEIEKLKTGEHHGTQTSQS